LSETTIENQNNTGKKVNQNLANWPVCTLYIMNEILLVAESGVDAESANDI